MPERRGRFLFFAAPPWHPSLAGPRLSFCLLHAAERAKLCWSGRAASYCCSSEDTSRWTFRGPAAVPSASRSLFRAAAIVNARSGARVVGHRLLLRWLIIVFLIRSLGKPGSLGCRWIVSGDACRILDGCESARNFWDPSDRSLIRFRRFPQNSFLSYSPLSRVSTFSPFVSPREIVE